MERSDTLIAGIAGAAIGSFLGYLLFTRQGRALKRRLESSFEEIAAELIGFRGTVGKVTAAAAEGWRLLDDFGDALGDGRSSARSSHSNQTSPF